MKKHHLVITIIMTASLACGGQSRSDAPGSVNTPRTTSPQTPAIVLPDPTDPQSLRSEFLEDCLKNKVSKDNIESWADNPTPVRSGYVAIMPLSPSAKYTCEQQYQSIIEKESIFINKFPAESIEPVKYFTHFTFVSIADTRLQDLSPLLNNQNIRELHITRDQHLTDADFAIISEMKSLERLNIMDTNLSEIGFLNQMPNLREARVAYNQITDLSSIANLPDKLRVIVNDNPINPELFCNKPATNNLVNQACGSPEDLEAVLKSKGEQ